MAFLHSLHFILLLNWFFNIFCIGCFVAQWHKETKNRTGTYIFFAATAVLFFFISSFVSVRGGYDNNHDYLCLAADIFSPDTTKVFSFKEIAPLFTDSVSNFISGNSMSALILKNRLLFVLSAFLFFIGLRKLKAGFFPSAAATVLLFFNFLSLMNASAFSTTASNIFIFVSAVLAAADAYSADKMRPASFAWMFSSLILIIMSRYEFAPVYALFITAVLLKGYIKKDRFFRDRLSAVTIAAGLTAAVLFSAAALGIKNPGGQLVKPVKTSLYMNSLYYQFWLNDINIMLGGKSAVLPEGESTPEVPAGAKAFALLILLAASAAAACNFYRKGAKSDKLIFSAVLSAWIIYFIIIFQPLDKYPFHFMRHQLYFLLPFAYLAAAAAEGLGGPAEKKRAVYTGGIILFSAVYILLNARTALANNNSLRTNDEELVFIMNSQRSWPAEARLLYPMTDPDDFHAALLARYFPAPDPRTELKDILAYASTEKLFGKHGGPLEHKYISPAADAVFVSSKTFVHEFYTEFREKEERKEEELTVGFYRINGNSRAEGQLYIRNGVLETWKNDFGKAAEYFRKAADTDDGCLPCLYLAACSSETEKNKKEAERYLSVFPDIKQKEDLDESMREIAEQRGEKAKIIKFSADIMSNRPETVFYMPLLTDDASQR